LFLDPTVADTLDTVSQRLNEPLITFTQAERSWPQPGSGAGNVPPQYYWECMFRRTGGRVQVAVLVYRVTAPGGDPSRYSVARIDSTLLGASLPAGSMDATVQTPPLPMVYYAPVPGQSGSWPNRTNALAPTNTPANGYSQFPVADEIPNTHAGTPFGAGKTWDDWMAPGQIWVDNHGNLHAVRSGRLLPGTTATASPGNPNQGPVKLRRRIPIMPRAPVYGVSPTAPSTPPNQTPLTPNAYINAIWFLPNSDARGNTITPIYATVEEL
jgi:hypothetical protein